MAAFGFSAWAVLGKLAGFHARLGFAVSGAARPP
jgi:hypothetical protein